MDNLPKPEVCVVGLGYIGLPTAALLANRGFVVKGVDVNEEVVNIINSGKIHIKEPGLATFVEAAINSGRLSASTSASSADIFIIAVPTPFKNEESEIPQPDLSYIEKAADMIERVLKRENLIILESTSPVGTLERLARYIYEKREDLKDTLYFAYCPERVLPGKIVKELIENDRIVGGLNEESAQVAGDFYRSFVAGEVLLTDSRTAEMCKLVENSFRDVNIAFANELSILCDDIKIDVRELIALANRHPRVNILKPGPGVGGHCIAVDPWFIVSSFPQKSRLIKTAREVNDYKTKWVTEKIKNEALNWEMEKGRKPLIACLGLSYKPDIDDLRESPAVKIVADLEKENFSLLVVEPNIQTYPTFRLEESLKKALEKSDIVVFLVAHREFKEIKNNEKMRELLSSKIILDFCGVING